MFNINNPVLCQSYKEVSFFFFFSITWRVFLLLKWHLLAASFAALTSIKWSINSVFYRLGTVNFWQFALGSYGHYWGVINIHDCHPLLCLCCRIEASMIAIHYSGCAAGLSQAWLPSFTLPVLQDWGRHDCHPLLCLCCLIEAK